MQKLCSVCSQSADFSINVLVSTVGVSKRLQETSRAMLFCDACLQKSSDRLYSNTLRKAVNNALTQLKTHLRERSTLDSADRD